MSNVVNLAEQIERLEAFQEITAQQQIEQLQDRIEELESQPADITAAIRILSNHTSDVIERQELAAQVEALQEDNQQLHAQLRATVGNTEEAIRQRDHYQQQCDALLKKHNAEVDKANAAIKALQAKLATEQTEVKRLRAINPDKLKKQVANLQKKNKELLEGNALLNKRLVELKHHKSRNIELEQSNRKLLADNRALDNALMNLCDQHNDESKTLLRDLGGGWQIHSSDDTGCRLTILDTTTDCARQYVRDQGVAKVRQIPNSVAAAIEAEFASIAEWRETAVDYVAMSQPE